MAIGDTKKSHPAAKHSFMCLFGCRKLDEIEGLVRQVLFNQGKENILEMKMSATLADIDAELAKSDTTVAALKADNDKIITILQSGPQTPDVTAQLTHLQNVNAALGVILAADDAALGNQPAS